MAVWFFSLKLLHAILQTFWEYILLVLCPLQKWSCYVPEAPYESTIKKVQEQLVLQRICQFSVRVNRCRKNSEKEDKIDHHGGWKVVDTVGLSCFE